MTPLIFDRDPPADLDTAVLAVAEPHDNLHTVWEHGQTWVNCSACGAQWAIHGSNAEAVTEGDGTCEGEEQ